MPELPDIEAYRAALAERVEGRALMRACVISPFFLRTFEPPIEALLDRRVSAVERLGKRIVLTFEAPKPAYGQQEMLLAFHLMIAGRFRWSDARSRPPGKISLASFEFESGVLHVVEPGQKKRAALHVLSGRDALRGLDRGGIDVLTATSSAFRAAIMRGNHTLKRALSDPSTLDGIGNAYADEILHAARLSPVKLSSRLSTDEIGRLHDAARATLRHWIDELCRRFARKFPGPGDITAFRPEFAVHGKYGRPCPVCGTSVQRIRYAENETNYCPRCQTGDRVLADRSLSRLLRGDWPRTVEELER
ncbi:MAG: DNA-formamidopyrimidine glycosylase family protein [Phycisphaerae bacterium]